MLKLSFRQQVLNGFIVSLLLVAIVFYFSYDSITELHKNQDLVENSESVIKTAVSVRGLLLDGETGQRGYIATAQARFLEPYNKSVSRVLPALTSLKRIIANNPPLRRNADSLAFYTNLKLQELASIIQIARTTGFDSARNALAKDPGKYDMDQVRFWIGRLISEETKLLRDRKAASDSAQVKSADVIVIGGIIIASMVLMLFSYILRSYNQVKNSEEKIRATNAELETVLAENTAKNWLLTGLSLLNEKMQGQQTEKALAENVLTEICCYAQASAGTFYLFNAETERLDMYASFAINDPDELKQFVRIDEGWLGQVAKDRKPALIEGKLNDKLELGSSLINEELAECFIVPFFFDKQLKGVIEVAFHNKLEKRTSDYILAIADDIGIAVNTAMARTVMNELLSQVQQQAEELEAQQEEMRLTNEELLTKTEMLQESEEELRSQQEELRTTNAELEEKAALLQEKNEMIEEAHHSINLKVQELETTGRYRSEFLANVSHELRTPLNSILVLAQVLKENKPANLSPDQVKYANVIFNAGNDLLTLINNILDLSKIESGTLQVQNETVVIAEMVENMQQLFAQVATSKKIKFSSYIGKDVPAAIVTDRVRIEQVLKNLLSNAFKFTPEKGSVEINVTNGIKEDTVRFCVKDSGIGIVEDKQKIIFEAFQQVDGSTSRKYGGTGLGLSISRGLVDILQGELGLNSKPGKGSEFYLAVPVKPGLLTAEHTHLPVAQPQNGQPVHEAIKPATTTAGAEKVILIFEDDKNFAEILCDFAREHGLVPKIINDGADAVEAVRQSRPDAVILDIKLPGKDGWQILKELKQDKETMHIPVHLMSAGDAAANRVRFEGAIGFMRKPADQSALHKMFNDIVPGSGDKRMRILSVSDSKTQDPAIDELARNQSLIVGRAFDGATALRMLDEKEYRCVILDLSLPDMPGLDLLDKIKAVERFKALPVIINTSTDLDKESVRRLMGYANAMVVKTGESSKALMNEVDLFLDKITAVNKPERVSARAAKTELINGDAAALKGKKVLIVDDDLRNIFALNSALQGYGMIVEIAADGGEAIDRLERVAAIKMVLMDIMMPVMDGYEAMRHIRKQPQWADLPIIALTAKAMSHDREKCIAAGASEYIDKPIDVHALVSLMLKWLNR